MFDLFIYFILFFFFSFNRDAAECFVILVFVLLNCFLILTLDWLGEL